MRTYIFIPYINIHTPKRVRRKWEGRRITAVDDNENELPFSDVPKAERDP